MFFLPLLFCTSYYVGKHHQPRPRAPQGVFLLPEIFPSSSVRNGSVPPRSLSCCGDFSCTTTSASLFLGALPPSLARSLGRREKRRARSNCTTHNGPSLHPPSLFLLLLLLLGHEKGERERRGGCVSCIPGQASP